MTYEEKLKKVNENLRYMEETAEKQRQTNAQAKAAEVFIDDVAEELISVLNRYGIKIKDVDTVFTKVSGHILKRDTTRWKNCRTGQKARLKE